jgi:hypothetical protein
MSLSAGGFLHALALARAVLVTARSRYENSPRERARLTAKAEHLARESAWLREELRIEDARMARIEPSKRPRYAPVERLAVVLDRFSHAAIATAVFDVSVRPTAS